VNIPAFHSSNTRDNRRLATLLRRRGSSHPKAEGYTILLLKKMAKAPATPPPDTELPTTAQEHPPTLPKDLLHPPLEIPPEFFKTSVFLPKLLFNLPKISLCF
jgi:hypothetical protein